jgi:phosphate:Na+ symporter
MIQMLFQIMGGVGLFLLGMVLMTDGLKTFAGDSLRKALIRFTGTPTKAFLSGTLVTAAVQSSSATTVTVIGFVSAGLLTLPQSLGVVIGASLGNTGTGWIVSVLGLKVSLGLYSMPVICVGTFMRLIASGRYRSMGLALAGFGLIFLGIDLLQTGMKSLPAYIDFAALPASGLMGHMIVMLIGFGMTLVMQSSSAAIAMTLTALDAGAINFEQAASLVVGASIGTTITSVLAAFSANVPARRTALAYVLFNLTTGVFAIALLPLLLWGISLAQKHLGLDPGATSLAAFHTIFIGLGALAFMPFINGFANLIEKAMPETTTTLTRYLDKSLLQTPAVALEASQRALREATCQVLADLHRLVSRKDLETLEKSTSQLDAELDQVQQFLEKIPAELEGTALSQSRVAQIHAIDHIIRLRARLNVGEPIGQALSHPRLHELSQAALRVLETGRVGLHEHANHEWLQDIQNRVEAIGQSVLQHRAAILTETGAGRWPAAEALTMLDAIRWHDRVSHHTWRVCHYLQNKNGNNSEPPPEVKHDDEPATTASVSTEQS